MHFPPITYNLFPTTYFMAGHNKWAQIKRQKGAADAAKSRLWGKLGKRIAVESKKARGDINAASLRSVVEQAKKANMPKDTIDRAVAKGISTEASALESILYEAYGPGGAAILIQTVTDSRNRTAQEIKHLLDKNGLALAAQGSALWAFVKTTDGYEPKTTVELSGEESAKLMEILNAIDDHDDVEEVYTNAE
ncbi:MAG TPA: YebC/PmpR family DNA-binding transcriptional regulator [Candidatus Paceibacterota bacterium]